MEINFYYSRQVVRRRKATSSSGRPLSSQHRASFPMVRPALSESKVAARLEQSLQPNMAYENGDDNSSSDRIDGTYSSLPLKKQTLCLCTY